MASIALAALVLPSRALRRACALLGVAALLSAVNVQFSPASFHTPLLVTACCALLCGLSVHACTGRAKAHQIDISGLGQIRLTVQLCIGREPAATPDTQQWPATREVRLLPASTLWPQLLLLLLCDSDGMVIPVVVLPDSVSPEAFRALACACRAVRHRAEVVQKMTID